MKKKTSRTGSVFKRFFNVRAWSDFDRTKSFTEYLFNGLRRLFMPEQKEPTETFDEAMKRLNLTENDVETKQKSLLRLSYTMAAFAIGIFLYLIYQLIFGSIKAAIVSLVVIAIALVLAFRYHFWYFQIKNKKLGCSIQEWYRQGLMGEKQ